MAEKKRFFDLWIVEANTVYQEVPFDVVADWVQQGRLLEDDMLRPSGTRDWRRLGDFVDFGVYIPKPAEAQEIPSPVEPMEPVETGFSWRRRPLDPEDAEVDMIPLIDVSLVLLIFFMLTTTDIGAGGPMIRTPPAEYGSVVNASNDVWVGINLEGEGNNRVPVYSCGVGGGPAAENDQHLATQSELLQHLQTLLASKTAVELTIDANPDVKSGDVRQLTGELEKEPFRSKIERKYTGVSDKQP